MRKEIRLRHNLDTHIDVLVFVILMVLVMLSGIANASVSIELKDKVSILAGKILLKDIASVNGEVGDEKLVSKLNSVEMCNSPQLGQVSNIKSDYVKLRLRQVGIDVSNISFVEDAYVSVSRKTKMLEGRVILDKAITFVKSNLSGSSDEIEVEPVKQVSDIEVLDLDSDVEIVPNPSMDYDGKINLLVKISQGDSSDLKVPVNLNIRRFAEVLVASKRIEKEEVLNEENIVLQKKEVTNLGNRYFKNIKQLDGKRAKSFILSGQILNPNMLERPTIIKRQNLVTIIYEIPNMLITTKGVAKEDGCEGDVIRVTNLDSKKEIEALVVNGSTVKIIQ